MQTILISEDLLQKVISGEKTTTCRKGTRDYELARTLLKSNSTDNFTYIILTKMNVLIRRV